jgi:branched-chain amino acid transport system permease protein
MTGRLRIAGWSLVLVAGLLFPLVFTNPATLSIALVTLMYVGLASSWNILGGFAGYVSLGISAFFGFGGYAFAITLHAFNVQAGYMPFAWLPLIGVLTAVVAIPLGWAALRTRQAVFVTVTIALMFVIQLTAENLVSITGGATGYGFPIPSWSAAFYYKPFYYAMLTVVVVSIAVAYVVRRSGLGLGLLAIRDDEDKAEAIGVPTKSYKLTAFVISAGLAGMIGAIFAYSVLYIYPQNAVDPLISMGAALMAFLGGAGTLAGPVLGALILAPAQTELSYYVNGQLYLILYGALFLAIVRLLPRGIIPSIGDLLRSRSSRHVDLLEHDGHHAEGRVDADDVKVMEGVGE